MGYTEITKNLEDTMKINETNNYNVCKNQLRNFCESNKKSYLLTNGLGGYSSLTSSGGLSRLDHGLFIAAKTAPNHRVHMVSNIIETITINEVEHNLSSQQFVSETNNYHNGMYLNSFNFKYTPKWNFKISGFEIIKEIVMVNRKNTVGVRYKIYNHSNESAVFNITPLFRLTNKDELPKTLTDYQFNDNYTLNTATKLKCYYQTNGNINYKPHTLTENLYFDYDAIDGRFCTGKVVSSPSFDYSLKDNYSEIFIIFSDNLITDSINDLFIYEINRQTNLIKTSKFTNPNANSLVLACDKFIVNRKSTKGKTIIAGYPFFTDWGRDTMIAIIGCAISTKRFEDAKSILRTFQLYEKNGMMPNMFGEGENIEPLYNTVDASLLFIDAVYQLFLANSDLEFVRQMYQTMENIIYYYRKGTSFHIKMDTDGLITAGADLEQLTWMDIRFDDVLPTPRHGKPVEINAYWYNALMILDYFSKKLNFDSKDYYELAEHLVKPSFIKKFWNDSTNCLKDVISNTKADEQIRLNQIWSLSMSFTMIDNKMANKILAVVYTELYTPYGLRSLSPNDPEFKPNYGGSWYNRDMAYHQGTVWGFPLGAYYLAVLRYQNNIDIVMRQLENTCLTLHEGCLGQIAEIFDGLNPTDSKGCFAQAWSCSEILRVYEKIEKMKKNRVD